MARISTYQKDTNITDSDFWIGSDGADYNATKNFTPSKLAEYFNSVESINIASLLRYRYDTIDVGANRVQGTFSFEEEIGANVNFSSITQIVLSEYTKGGNNVPHFFNILPKSTILISKSDRVDYYGLYKVTNITPHLTDTGFYTVDLEFIIGNANIQEDKDYLFSLIDYNTPTKTSDLVNDGQDGVHPFITAEDAPTPTLQSVTDEGNTTTTTVHLDGGALSDSINEQALFQPDSISTKNKNSGAGAEMSSLGYVAVSPDGISLGIFAAEYITGEITLQFPNKPTGTYFIATTDDVNTQGLPTGGTAGQILTKVDATDYNAQWVDEAPAASFTSTIKHKVKLGAAIAKGQAVYVSSADGTNMIVSKASNTSEATSSKTMGLLETGGNTNAQVNVVTEGLLAGLNTAGQTAGDPVWLGTNGDLIYGLINKPYAPAHLVFIGIVTRVNSSNGEIFVKCQNGFELQELHNIDLITTTPINGHLLGYDGTLWVNKTIAGWLGYTPTKLIQLGSQTLAFASWSLVGGFYTYTFSNVNITSTSVVDFTPNNASINEVSSCRMLPQVDVASGFCTFYATFPPQSNITGTINVWQ